MMDFLGRVGSAGLAALSFHTKRWWREYLLGLALLLCMGFSGYALLLAPPKEFPVGAIITIPVGKALPQIADQLSREAIIAHPLAFILLVRGVGGAGSVQAGSYRFATAQNLAVVALRLLSGDTDIVPVRIRFPEGSTARDMSIVVARALPTISVGTFLAAAGPYEGYLFPDTYRFLPNMSAEAIVALMRADFNTRIASIDPKITVSGHSLSDIVTLASLVEKEARTTQDKRIVAGILWHRIALLMPLQVDAVFGYIYGRSIYSPSLEDLATDSPYNTYKHRGLPPGPIDNPGLDSLRAAADPIPSTYLYYLTGIDGTMHYAATFAEHQANRAKYL